MAFNLTNQQYILLAVVVFFGLYSFDYLPLGLGPMVDAYLPDMIKNIIKPSQKIVVVVPKEATTSTKLPEGKTCDQLDATQCGLYKSACELFNDKCRAVPVGTTS